jgi:hypothetical protein
MIWALIKAQGHGWGNAYVLGFGLVGLLVLVGFVVREARTAAPLTGRRRLRLRVP